MFLLFRGCLNLGYGGFRYYNGSLGGRYRSLMYLLLASRSECLSLRRREEGTERRFGAGLRNLTVPEHLRRGSLLALCGNLWILRHDDGFSAENFRLLLRLLLGNGD